MTDPLHKLGWLSALLFVVIAGRIMQGFALSTLWGWFMVSTFGVPHLPIPHAIGVAIAVGLITSTPSQKDERYDPWFVVFWVCFTPGAALGVGWFVLQFVS